MKSVCIVVIGFGSRGDVLPLFVTLEKLLQVGIPELPEVHLITNASHSYICSYLLRQYSNQLHVHFIDKGVIVANDSAASADFYDSSYIIDTLLLLLQRKLKIGYVISNLFALESWIVSVAFRSRCLIIHPTTPFTSLEQCHAVKATALTLLKTIRPQLYSSKSSNDNISWEDYALWLWPLLVDSDENKETIRKIFSIAKSYGFHHTAQGEDGIQFTGGRSSVDDDLIYLLVQSAREPPRVLIAMSPTLLESASDEYLDSIVLRSCIGQVTDNAGLFLEVPLLEGDRDGDGVVSADNGNLLSMMGNLRLEDTGHRGVVFVDFGSLTDWIVDTFHIHTLFSALYLLGSTYRFVVVAHRQHERFRQVCEEVSREMPGVVSSPIILVAGDVQHTAVLHKFVSVVSHAGVGIVNTCLRIGIPQVTIPFMYDQQKWATRVQQLRIGPGPLDREVILPELGQVSAIGTTVQAAYTALRDALQESSSPQCRLRAGTLGRKHRDNVDREDGNANAFRIVSNEIKRRKKSCVLINNDLEIMLESEVGSEDSKEAVFPGGLTVFCHPISAPEETAFLFDEIFCKQVYNSHGILLKKGDVVLDIGANVGFFSIFAELQFGDCCNALQIISVEPLRRNFEKLVKNLKKYVPTAKCIRAAVGDPDLALYEEKQGRYSTNIVFDRRCPGNACCERYFRRNCRHRAMYMNPTVTGCQRNGDGGDSSGHRLDDQDVEDDEGSSPCYNLGDKDGKISTEALVESCPLMSLSEIIEAAWSMSSDSVARPSSIALLKLDVEGGEWEILRSLRDERHWSSIHQIVLEAALCVCSRCRSETEATPTDTVDVDHDDVIENVQQLLSGKGFKVVVDYNPWGWDISTGNAVLYATRIS